MKLFRFLCVFSGTLILGGGAVRAQEKPQTQTSKPKIRFEARCEPDSPKKTLIVVNDTCYFLVAPKDNKPLEMRMQDYGAANLFVMKGVPIESEEGKALLLHVPKKFNNQLRPKILVVNDAE